MTAPSILDMFEAVAHDETGALTRRVWFAQAARYLAEAEVGCRPAVVMVDVDHFKACNDTFGHLAGDRVLAAVVWALRTGLRHVDLIGRYGGDELAVVLAGDHDRAAASGIADRLRRRVEDVVVEVPGVALGSTTREVHGLTVSIGAAVPRDGARPELLTMLAAADAALYGAKAAGRNRALVVEAPTVSRAATRQVPDHGR